MLFGMSLINSFTHIQENWKFVIICVQNQWGVVHPWHGTVANLWGRYKDFTEFNAHFEKSYLLNGLSNIVNFSLFGFLKYSALNESISFSEYSVLLSFTNKLFQQLGHVFVLINTYQAVPFILKAYGLSRRQMFSVYHTCSLKSVVSPWKKHKTFVREVLMIKSYILLDKLMVMTVMT